MPKPTENAQHQTEESHGERKPRPDSDVSHFSWFTRCNGKAMPSRNRACPPLLE
jgi:hypothetical protein